MSETTAAVETAPAPTQTPETPKGGTTPPAAPKTAPAKKPAPKPKAAPSPTPKKPAAKSAPKAKGETKPSEKAKPSTNGHAKAGGLRGPQVRVLVALSKSNKPLTRVQIADKAKVDQAALVEYVGSADKARREANDKKHFPSLLSLGLVRADDAEVDGREVVVYQVTAKGRTAASKA